ncbi:hypothetical protein BN1723_002137 [Verticillium longisporum]|uniref:Mediator of RNA polymerase II transcription subunit 8 n=1 Tax=Verticillium longisporum TaxID=100787 RepID=A0A0G4KZW1_VERLO|nr:hypothetical protein BN1723_002137 [Verticillium longisporum]
MAYRQQTNALGLSDDETKALEQTRQRLYQLTNSIQSFKADVAKSNPLPPQSSLQAQYQILLRNLQSLLDIVNENAVPFAHTSVHPAEVWKELRAWTQERVAQYVIEEAGDVYTRDEREGGIENVRSGLRRPLEEPDESDDEDGDNDENEDEDVVMGDGAQSGAPQPGKVAGPEPEVFFWFSARGDFDLPRNVEFEKDAAKTARLAVAGGPPRIS